MLSLYSVPGTILRPVYTWLWQITPSLRGRILIILIMQMKKKKRLKTFKCVRAHTALKNGSAMAFESLSLPNARDVINHYPILPLLSWPHKWGYLLNNWLLSGECLRARIYNNLRVAATSKTEKEAADLGKIFKLFSSWEKQEDRWRGKHKGEGLPPI